MPRRSLLALVLLLVLFLPVWTIFYRLPLTTLHIDQRVIMIPRGASLNATAKILQSEGVISYAKAFVVLGRLLRATNKIQWGEYEFAVPEHPITILNKLIAGEIKLYTLKIPEGYTVTQIADLLTEQQLIARQEFLDYALSEVAAREQQVAGPTLEGYLFPSTYQLWRGMSASEIAHQMVVQYRKIFTDELRRQAAALGLNERQAVTMASIVEKETGVGDERNLIASVYFNRLRKRMRLQADPTVIYGIKDFDGNLKRKHLTTYSPYNTYVIYGLPPGPIANPGAAALLAAVSPATSDYLYFVATGNGAHVFTKTYADHQVAVWQYQLKRSPKKAPKRLLQQH